MHRLNRLRTWAICLAVNVLLVHVSLAQTPTEPPGSIPSQNILVTVTDENNVAVPSALVFLQASLQAVALRCVTDFAGHCEFSSLSAATYQLRVEKQGFYSVMLPSIQIGAAANIVVTLAHQQEVREVVDVVESPPAIDPAAVSAQEQLTGVDMINLPYPTTRDYRNALNFVSGVVNDVFGQPHIAGSETYQTLTLLDGFNVTHPGTGQLLMRVSSDSLRLLDVEASRTSAEYGKGSGGVLSLNTGIGDDHFRYSGTNFIPSVQNKKGLTFDKVAPRFTVSGPIRKGKMWFFDSPDGEYDNIVIPELPNGADRDRLWRFGNLAKVQTNLTTRDILTTSFNINHLHDDHAGLSLLNPVVATPSDIESAYLASVKNQYYFHGGELFETGLAFVEYNLGLTPAGTLPYFISPETTGGNYYLFADTHARRWQGLANLYLPPKKWHGQHEVQTGIDTDRLTYHADFQRMPISFLREGQRLPSSGDCLTVTLSPCSRYSVFSGGGNSSTYNLEASGYIQDRWLATNRLLIEPGLRFDWDQIIRSPLLSPRLAGTYVLDSQGNTKLSAGVGIVYDATNLLLVAQPLAGQRLDYFFDSTGNLLSPPVITTFSANTRTLQEPRYLNWSLGLEQKLPGSVYLKAEFMQRNGTQGLVYNMVTGQNVGDFILRNTREDHYQSFQVNLRRAFRHRYTVFGSYTRSSSRSNQVLDFNVDNPILSAQAAGPYPWDAPNRFVSWGLVPFFHLPIIHEFDLAYSLEARSGFPFNVTNDLQQLVEPPGTRRFPSYFSLNLFVEKRFHAFGRDWALRGGLENITDHANPAVVNANINSPDFLAFSAFQGRSFVTRIRLLGKK